MSLTKSHDRHERPKPWLITTIASYLALVAFVGMLGGAVTWRWDLLRVIRKDASHLVSGEGSTEPDPAARVGHRFWPGFAVGSALGVLFIAGYRVQHGWDHLASDR